MFPQGVKQLVESGANINARSRESKNHTALHEAVIGGHKEVAQYLLEMGANQVPHPLYQRLYE